MSIVKQAAMLLAIAALQSDDNPTVPEVARLRRQLDREPTRDPKLPSESPVAACYRAEREERKRIAFEKRQPKGKR